MSSTFYSPSSYEITVEGSLDQSMSNRLAGMSIHYSESDAQTTTLLTGDLLDQAELLGVLNTLFNYRCTVLSLHKI